jgi:hypothetical protein
MEQQCRFFFNLRTGQNAHFEFLVGSGKLVRKITQEAVLNVNFWSLHKNTEKFGGLSSFWGEKRVTLKMVAQRVS